MPTQGQLLVGLVDGRLLGVDAATGAVEWTAFLGGPLVGSSARAAAGSGQQTLLPGTDGSLYMYRQGDAQQAAAFERLPASVPGLVAMSPSRTGDGGLLLGARTSALLALDPTTGSLTACDPVGPGAPLKPGQLLLGRTTFTVRSLDALTGAERWNVSYARLEALDSPWVPAAAAEDSDALAPLGLEPRPDPGHLLLRPDNHLQWVPATGACAWSLQLPSVAVAAFYRREGRLELHPLPLELRVDGAAPGAGQPSQLSAVCSRLLDRLRGSNLTAAARSQLLKSRHCDTTAASELQSFFRDVRRSWPTAQVPPSHDRWLDTR